MLDLNTGLIASYKLPAGISEIDSSPDGRYEVYTKTVLRDQTLHLSVEIRNNVSGASIELPDAQKQTQVTWAPDGEHFAFQVIMQAQQGKAPEGDLVLGD